MLSLNSILALTFELNTYQRFFQKTFYLIGEKFVGFMKIDTTLATIGPLSSD